MFKLVKYLGGRINQGETRKITVQETMRDIPAGTPVRISGGLVSKMDAESTILATHLVEKAASAGSTEVTVTDILPGMVFEVPLSGDFSDMLDVNSEYVTDGQALLPEVADIAMDIRGVRIYEYVHSPKAGDKVLVTFPYN